jgi:hypothetical protein
MLGIAGVTVIETRAAGVTVSVLDPLMLPELAMIVVWPRDRLTAWPTLGAAPFTVATPVADEFQATEFVMSRVLPSL